MQDTTERVGKFEMTVAEIESQPDDDQHRARRAEALAAWLLARWVQERKEAVAA